jgi:hypothetical protein
MKPGRFENLFRGRFENWFRGRFENFAMTPAIPLCKNLAAPTRAMSEIHVLHGPLPCCQLPNYLHPSVGLAARALNFGPSKLGALGKARRELKIEKNR